MAGSILWMAGLDVFAPRDANQLLRHSKRNKTRVAPPFPREIEIHSRDRLIPKVFQIG